jgi:hypothetical protein
VCFRSRPTVKTINRAPCAVKWSLSSSLSHFLKRFIYVSTTSTARYRSSSPLSLAIVIAIAQPLARSHKIGGRGLNPPFTFLLTSIELARRLTTYIVTEFVRVGRWSHMSTCMPTFDRVYNKKCTNPGIYETPKATEKPGDRFVCNSIAFSPFPLVVLIIAGAINATSVELMFAKTRVRSLIKLTSIFHWSSCPHQGNLYSKVYAKQNYCY